MSPLHRERDSAAEMLLGFSEAVYYLNKMEKALLINKNVRFTTFFATHIPGAVAWIIIAQQRVVPERETIEQARQFEPEIIAAIHDPLYYQTVDESRLHQLWQTLLDWLMEMTAVVYRPVIRHMERHGMLRGFTLNHRRHGFGINYNWLCRAGIAERRPEPITLGKQRDELYFGLEYYLK